MKRGVTAKAPRYRLGIYTFVMWGLTSGGKRLFGPLARLADKIITWLPPTVQPFGAKCTSETCEKKYLCFSSEVLSVGGGVVCGASRRS